MPTYIPTPDALRDVWNPQTPPAPANDNSLGSPLWQWIQSIISNPANAGELTPSQQLNAAMSSTQPQQQPGDVGVPTQLTGGATPSPVGTVVQPNPPPISAQPPRTMATMRRVPGPLAPGPIDPSIIARQRMATPAPAPGTGPNDYPLSSSFSSFGPKTVAPAAATPLGQGGIGSDARFPVGPAVPGAPSQGKTPNLGYFTMDRPNASATGGPGLVPGGVGSPGGYSPGGPMGMSMLDLSRLFQRAKAAGQT